MSLAVASSGARWLSSFPGSLSFLVSPASGSVLFNEGALIRDGCVGQGESLMKSLRETGLPQSLKGAFKSEPAGCAAWDAGCACPCARVRVLSPPLRCQNRMTFGLSLDLFNFRFLYRLEMIIVPTSKGCWRLSKSKKLAWGLNLGGLHLQVCNYYYSHVLGKTCLSRRRLHSWAPELWNVQVFCLKEGEG